MFFLKTTNMSPTAFVVRLWFFYVVGGLSTAMVSSMSWQAVASLPAAGRHHPITFANETHGFLLTGTTVLNSYTSDMYLYDPRTDTWTELLPTDDAASTTAPVARSYSYGVVLPVPGHTKAYLGLGASDDPRFLSDWWEFDMSTLEWKQLADFPGPARRHPAMNVVKSTTDEEEEDGGWEIHIGLGDGLNGNLNDWWAYTIDTDTWRQLPDFPSSQRHHPFYFAIGSTSYAGLGHADFSIERDWYSIENETWARLPDFSSSSLEEGEEEDTVVTTEARVAGAQFSITLNGKSLGFVLSGDGDDHRTMPTGEFHAFVPEVGLWKALPPHPGPSRWAPGSFVLRGTTEVYFMAGYDRSTAVLYNDMWKIDVQELFLPLDEVVADDGVETTVPVDSSNTGDDIVTPTNTDTTSASASSTTTILLPSSLRRIVTAVTVWMAAMVFHL